MKTSAIALAAFWLVPTAVQAGGFLSSCQNVYFVGNTVGGNCFNARGEQRGTSANCAQFIGNRNGYLSGHSNYILNCECNSASGWKRSSIDLSKK
ncbi:hypothetical protein ABW20_dc0105882 [Dactylellina cionopaga]|nr:hypothetical protein ABW20_dc0105882 [Dactylellina cionopaga]